MGADSIDEIVEVARPPGIPFSCVDLDRDVGLGDQLVVPGREVAAEFDQMIDGQVDLRASVTGADPCEECVGLRMQQHEDVDAWAGGHEPTHFVEDPPAVGRVLEELCERRGAQHGEVGDDAAAGIGRGEQLGAAVEERQLRVEGGRGGGLPGVVAVEERVDRDRVEQQVGAEPFGDRTGGGALADARRPVDRHDGHRHDDTARFVGCARPEYRVAMRIWRLHELGDPAEQLRLVEEDAPVAAGPVRC